MAEAFYNLLTGTRDALSAGAAADNGSPVHSGVQAAMREKGIDMSNMASTRLTQKMFEDADKVIAFPTPYMPRWVLDTDKTEFWDVSDPYYQPNDGTNYVEQARDQIENHVRDLIARTSK